MTFKKGKLVTLWKGKKIRYDLFKVNWLNCEKKVGEKEKTHDLNK